MKHQKLNSNSDGHTIWKQSNNLPSSVDSNNNAETCDSQSSEWSISTAYFSQNIPREILSRMPMRLQLAYFRILTNENKLRVFTEKIHFIIQKDVLNQKEKEHLLALLSFFKPFYYEEKYSNMVESFYEKWTTYAINELNWTQERIFFYVENWQSKEERDLAWELEYYLRGIDNAYNPQDLPANPPTANVACECRYNISCPGYSGYCADSDKCRKVAECGLFGHSQCLGLCDPMANPVTVRSNVTRRFERRDF